ERELRQALHPDSSNSPGLCRGPTTLANAPNRRSFHCVAAPAPRAPPAARACAWVLALVLPERESNSHPLLRHEPESSSAWVTKTLRAAISAPMLFPSL